MFVEDRIYLGKAKSVIELQFSHHPRNFDATTYLLQQAIIMFNINSSQFKVSQVFQRCVLDKRDAIHYKQHLSFFYYGLYQLISLEKFQYLVIEQFKAINTAQYIQNKGMNCGLLR